MLRDETRTAVFEREARGSCELRGTGNVQEQISEDIVAPKRGYCLSYSSNIFQQGSSILGTFLENYLIFKQLDRRSKYFPSF